MATVFKFEEPKSERRAGTFDGTFHRTYSKIWRCITDHPKAGPAAVLANFLTPVGSYFIGKVYSEGSSLDGTFFQDLGSFLQSITVESASDDGKSWNLRLEYGPRDPGPADPLDPDAPVQVAWGSTSQEEIVDEDLDGIPVLNSAYDYFDPPLVRDCKLPTVTIVRNEAQFDYVLVADYQDAISSDVFLGLPAGLWKVMSITGQSAQRSKDDGTVIPYWIVTYVLCYSRNGWRRPLLNQGMRQLNVAGTGWEPILIKGQPTANPVPLDAAGRVLAPSGTPIFLDFKSYDELPFATLNFTGVDFGLGPI